MSEKWDYTYYGGTTTADRPFAHAEVGVDGSMELVCCLDGDYEEKPKLKKRAALIAAAPEMYECLCDALSDLQMSDGMRKHFESVLKKARGESDVSDGKENEND